MATGWTWDYIDECMTLPRLKEMSAYWERYPPLHVLVAAYFGFPKSAPALGEGDLEGDIAAANATMRPF